MSTPDLRLVGREIDDAVRNYHVHAGVGQRQMLDFSQAKLDVIQAGGLAVARGILARLGQHHRPGNDGENQEGENDGLPLRRRLIPNV